MYKVNGYLGENTQKILSYLCDDGFCIFDKII